MYNIYTHLPLLPQERSPSQLETWTIFKGKYGFLWPTLTSKKSLSKHLIKAKGNSFDALLDFVSTFLAGLQPASDWIVPQAKETKQTILMREFINHTSRSNWVVYSLWDSQFNCYCCCFSSWPTPHDPNPWQLTADPKWFLFFDTPRKKIEASIRSLQLVPRNLTVTNFRHCQESHRSCSFLWKIISFK